MSYPALLKAATKGTENRMFRVEICHPGSPKAAYEIVGAMTPSAYWAFLNWWAIQEKTAESQCEPQLVEH